MTEKKIYNTDQIARILGISKQTLLRYEEKKIFPRARRNPINKWREYSLQDVAKLKKVLGREM